MPYPLNNITEDFYLFVLILLASYRTLGIGDHLKYFRLAHSDYSGTGTADVRDNFLYGHPETQSKTFSS